MAAPVQRSAVATAVNAPGANVQFGFTMPPTITNGDTVIAIFARNANSLLTTTNVPAGWTRLASRLGNATTSGQYELWAKSNCQASEAGTTVSGWAGSLNRGVRVWAAAYEPLHLSTGFVHSEVLNNSSVAAITPPTVATEGESLTICGVVGTTSGTDYVTSGTGWTEADDGDSGTGTPCRLVTAVGSSAGAESHPAATFTRSTGTSTGCSFQFAMVGVASNLLPDVTVAASAGGVRAPVGQETQITAVGVDLDGTIVSYAWTQYRNAGVDPTPAAIPTLLDAATATVRFTPTVPGAFTLQVVAIDDDGASSTPVQVGVVAYTAAGTTTMKARVAGSFVAKPVKARSAGTFS